MARFHPIRWLREHALAADLLLAVVITGVAVAMHWAGAQDLDDAASPSWWGTILVVAASLPIALRRVSPIPVALGIVLVQVVSEAVGVQGSGWVGLMIAVYSLGAHTSGRPRTRATIAIVVLLSSLLISGLIVDQIGPGSVIGSGITLTTAFVLGDNLQRRRQAIADLAERAERAERERDLLAREKVTEERTRIARELHDVVAHSVSVMIIQAGAARRTLRADPDAAVAALTTIEGSGREAMAELRRVLGVLRHADQADLAPQPSIDSLRDLVADDHDLPIRLEVADDLGDLPPSVELTGYRVVQEALTNVRRHAGPVTKVDVRLCRIDDRLVIEVNDDGRGAAADSVPEGFGLVGMRERISTVGGTLDVGPHRGGGWHVRAELPVGAPA
jgi:signal transduction histidine kinase